MRHLSSSSSNTKVSVIYWETAGPREVAGTGSSRIFASLYTPPSWWNHELCSRSPLWDWGFCWRWMQVVSMGTICFQTRSRSNAGAEDAIPSWGQGAGGSTELWWVVLPCTVWDTGPLVLLQCCVELRTYLIFFILGLKLSEHCLGYRKYVYSLV